MPDSDLTWRIADVVYSAVDARLSNVNADDMMAHVRPAAGVVLRFLMRHPNEWHSTDDLLKELSDNGYTGMPVISRQVIGELRRALADVTSMLSIESVRGIGYRLVGADIPGTIGIRLSVSQLAALSRIVAATRLSHPADARAISEVIRKHQ